MVGFRWMHLSCVVLGLLAAPLLTSLGAQQRGGAPIIRTSTTVVDVPMLVLDKQGQPMESLSQDDFNIFDNGIAQKLSAFDHDPRPLSLAIVVDTSDFDAIAQAKRSAELITNMVVGAAGVASVFTPGPEPRQLLDFTGDANKLGDVLRHLQKSPSAPQGQGSILEPLNMAVLDLRHQPKENTRAALVISRSSAKSGEGAQALIDSGMSDATPIFHLSPNRPKDAHAYVNPDSTAQRGVGQGSQRTVAPPAPVDSRGMPTSGAGMGNMDLGGVISAATSVAGKVLAAHSNDYVYATGGVYYSAGNDNDFDQKLSLIGDELRAIYHLYFAPNDLSDASPVHSIVVKLDVPATTSVGSTSYRRTYIGVQAH
ncbi:MAG TPA: VWA domain-containing protein [Terriglobales bacterium]|jgi:VWFA-related protein